MVGAVSSNCRIITHVGQKLAVLQFVTRYMMTQNGNPYIKMFTILQYGGCFKLSHSEIFFAVCTTKVKLYTRNDDSSVTIHGSD